jgi:hypothetical protein
VGVPGSISNRLVYSLIAAKGGLVAIKAADTAVLSDGNGVTPAAIVNVGYAIASHQNGTSSVKETQLLNSRGKKRPKKGKSMPAAF